MQPVQVDRSDDHVGSNHHRVEALQALDARSRLLRRQSELFDRRDVVLLHHLRRHDGPTIAYELGEDLSGARALRLRARVVGVDENVRVDEDAVAHGGA